jgi:Fe-S-cluster containining protein
MHAAYRCEHAGACCTAGWHIPVDATALQELTVHFGTHSHDRLFVTEGPLPDGAAAVLRADSAGRCLFFEHEQRLCAIHRTLGPRLLPSACRHFPRVVLTDARGTLITLSHFCPTAARLLFGHAPAQPVAAPASLTLDGTVEGLDATSALPPLLRPGLLTDIDGYDAWERRGLATLERDGLTPESALDTIAAATAKVQTWTPGSESFADAVRRAFDRVGVLADRSGDPAEDARRAGRARGSVPQGLAIASEVVDFEERWREIARWWPDCRRPVKRYLAAKLFGNWIAQYGSGLDEIVEYLRVCLSVVKYEAARTSGAARPEAALTEAIRAADLLLVHKADTRALVHPPLHR